MQKPTSFEHAKILPPTFDKNPIFKAVIVVRLFLIRLALTPRQYPLLRRITSHLQMAFALFCLSLLAALGSTDATIYYAKPDTRASFCDCVKQLEGPGDECRLHTGVYEVGAERCIVQGLRGTSSQPIIIASAGDGPVVIDGTVAIAGPWSREEDGLFTAAAPEGQDILQLFVDDQLQVLARYPNALWSDKSMFLAVENWFRSAAPGVHNLTTVSKIVTLNLNISLALALTLPSLPTLIQP